MGIEQRYFYHLSCFERLFLLLAFGDRFGLGWYTFHFRVSVLVSGDRFGLDWFGRVPYLALQCWSPVTDSGWIGIVLILKGFGFR